jgi:hypothetical protein
MIGNYIEGESLTQADLEKFRERWGNNYHLKECTKCHLKFIAGTTSKYCRSCRTEDLVSKEAKYTKNKRDKILKSIKQDKCFFCGMGEKLEIHHIDKDRSNNDKKNLLLLCGKCHKKLHGRVYNPLFKRVFKVLADERLTYKEIGQMFSTTRQNVYGIMKK